MKLLCGDCFDILPTLAADSVDCVCTDPPYHLTANSRGGSPRTNNPNTPFGRHRLQDKGFMGQQWDGGDVAFRAETWHEVLRVAKPGAHLVAFGGARTFHRLASAIEDAGWELRDCLMWVYGSAMPKSLNVSKALDRAAGAEREVIGQGRSGGGRQLYNGPNAGRSRDFLAGNYDVTTPASEIARIYDGYGTALKPAYEPILLCRKPLVGTVAKTVEQYGTGCLNIDGTRVAWDAKSLQNDAKRRQTPGTDFTGGRLHAVSQTESTYVLKPPPPGRWPPNLLLSHTLDCTDDACADDCPVALFPVTKSGALKAGHKQGAGMFGRVGGETIYRDYGNDSGSASRFFPRFRYNPKVSRKERNGCGHPTMKPIAVVEWLLTLIAPPLDRPQGQPVVLDPFMGSGTTGVAARNLGLDFIGIEKDTEYHGFATQRIKGLDGSGD